MMNYIKKEIGNLGENMARQYLEQVGFEILRRNYYNRVGEIDIIAYKDFKIHFIEVKSVSCETKQGVIRETPLKNGEFSKNNLSSQKKVYDEYNPADKVHRQKIRRIEKVAEIFLFENGLEEEAIQIDLIIVEIHNGGFEYKIEVVENINIG